MAEIRFNYGDKFTQPVNNNIGIGSTIPAAKLDVAGTASAGSLRVTGIATLSSVSGYVNTKLTTSTQDIIVEAGNSGSVSGEVVVSTGQTISVSTGATTGQGGIKSLKVYKTFMPPVGGTADRPTDVKPGMVYYNKDFKTIEFWDGNFWKQVDNTTRSTRAIICGGGNASSPYLSDIDTVNISTKGNATNFGELVLAVYSPSACASETRGIIFGGKASPQGTQDTIQYVTLPSEGDTVDFGNLTQATVHNAACSSSTRGISLGDYSQENVMSYIQIATVGDALDFGDLTVGRHTHTAAASPIHGFAIGGNTSDGNVGSIDRITISTTGNAIKFGDLSEIRGSTPGAASNPVTAIIYGGRSKNSTVINTIDKMNMSTQGSSRNFGELSQLGNQVTGATSSRTKVITNGGLLSGSVYTNTISIITISSSGGGEDFGDLTQPVGFHYSTSDSHGGLGGF